MDTPENKKTGCECPIASYCQRHGINKSPHMHKLCQNHQGYFDKWEECRGPGQQNIDCNKPPEKPAERLVVEEERPNANKAMPLPNLAKQATNLTKAFFNHAKSGFSSADKDLQQQRLDICDACPLLIRESSRCSACGCFVKSKVTMSSSSCPKGKW